MDEPLPDPRPRPLTRDPSRPLAGRLPRAVPAALDRGLVATGVLVTIIVVWGVRAATSRWIPTGDDAFLSLRTRHVLSTDPILLNNASSAGPSAGSQYNHPGAFPLTLLAPVTMLGGPGSLALATAMVNAGWVALISWTVRRVAGVAAQTAAVVALALLVWSMGATLLVDPWNPNYGILPVATMVVAAWGARRGHGRLLAVTVAAASVAFQTHLSLTVVAVVVAAWALAGSWRDRRTVALAAVVGAVANAQLLADQVFGTGNLSKIAGGTGFEEATMSVRQVLGVIVAKVAVPPMWFRGSWTGPVLPDEEPSTAVLVAGLAVVVVLTVAAVWRARRDRPAVAGLLGVVGVATASAAVVATGFPLRIGIPLPYLRWVWPLAAIWWVAVAAALLPARRVPDRLVTAAMVAVLVSVVAGSGVDQQLSPNPAWAQDIARPFSAAAVDATRALPDGEAVVVDQSIQEAALWVIPALIDQLDAAGLDVRADDAVLVQQTAERYRATGDERWHLTVRGGLQIDDAPAGARLLARHDALSEAERADLGRLVADLSPALDRPGAVRLSDVGRAETDAEALEHLTTGELPPEELLGSVPFRLALQRGAVVVTGVDGDDLDRATELGARDGGRSIALYLSRR